MSAEPEVKVTLTDTAFTLGELDHFLARARAIDGIPQNALVAVNLPPGYSSVSWLGPIPFELSVSTAYREKEQ
jgi:hypothetical protein